LALYYTPDIIKIVYIKFIIENEDHILEFSI